MSYFGPRSGGNRPQYGRGPAQEPEPKRKTGALGFMFNPQFGSSLGTIKETARMFVHLIALIFAQAGLIDTRHPAITNQDRGQYGLFDIIRIAYERVEWRQENIAQISMFLGVCACLAICAVGIVYALFSILFSVT